MLAQPSLVADALVSVLVGQRVAHPARLAAVNWTVDVPFVAVGASQNARAVCGVADPVASIVDIELEAEQAKALLSLTRRVALDLKCVPQYVLSCMSAVYDRSSGLCM